MESPGLSWLCPLCHLGLQNSVHLVTSELVVPRVWSLPIEKSSATEARERQEIIWCYDPISYTGTRRTQRWNLPYELYKAT